MSLFRRKKTKKVCVIGLDGVPYSLVIELAKKGIMETMAKLLDSGHLHRMKASLPEISAVSWTNFMTGSNPGAHGIFGFTDLKKESYDLHFPNFLDLKKETFWDRLADIKKRCIIINQPSTYPARRINGILVSGFVAIDLAKAVYPLSYKTALESMGYQIDIDTYKSRENYEFMWQELSRTLEGRLKAFESFWKEDWDYFEFVITGTDRLQHFLWNAYVDDQHPYHQNFLDYFREIDRVINKIISSFRKYGQGDESLFFLSDHGFTGIEQEVYLNAWLEKEGYLRFKTSPPKDLNEISSSSLAFAMDPNRIYLNTKGKFPLGCVDESEMGALKREISHKLGKLEFDDKKVVRNVFDAHEVYSGPFLEKGPDLIVLSEYGFDMKGSVKKKIIFGRTNLQGMHTWDDAFFWAHRNFGEDLCISDLASIIMEQFS